MRSSFRFFFFFFLIGTRPSPIDANGYDLSNKFHDPYHWHKKSQMVKAAFLNEIIPPSTVKFIAFILEVLKGEGRGRECRTINWRVGERTLFAAFLLL